MNKSEAALCLEIHLRELGLRYEPETLLVPHRKFRLDYWILSKDGREAGIEIDGAIWSRQRSGHQGAGHIRDMEKGNEAAIRGLRLFRFTPTDCLNGKAKETLRRWLKAADSGKK